MLAQANDQWSTGFMSDVLANRRKIRTLNFVDDAARECLAIEVDTSISRIRIGRVLSSVALWCPIPDRIVVDNGPEFTSKILDQWGYAHNVELRFIRPGRPGENCCNSQP